MDASESTAQNGQIRLKVSFITRLIAVFAYAIPAIGGAVGSFLLMKVFQGLRTAETAGVVAVMNGMKQAALPVTISLYLAAFFGIAVIIVLVVRMFVQTKTTSPPLWFFAVGGILCLVPAVLFWKTELLVIEVLSPGSSIGGAGISGVASNISWMLLASMAAAPVAVVIIFVLSVLPFSSRSGPKWGSLLMTIVVEITLVATAIAVPFLIDGPKRKNEIVQLPNVKFADRDYNLEKDTSVVITLTADNKLYQRQSRDLPDRLERNETIITTAELSQAIKRDLEGKTPDKRVVYFKCDAGTSEDKVLEVLDAVRKADVDKVALVVVGDKSADDPYQIAPLSFLVDLPAPMNKAIMLKPNPLTLVASLSKNERILLNNEDVGTLSDTSKLNDRLRDIFKDRENNGVFREDTNEVEKTVYVKTPRASKYGDLIKLVEAVKGAGAEPIAIHIDDVN